MKDFAIWGSGKKVLTMAKEYIDREEALSAIKQAFEKGERPSLYIKSIPAADVAPVVHGRWVNTHSDSEFVQCSLCKYPVYAAWNVTSYCPNCGAYMMGENNGKCE